MSMSLSVWLVGWWCLILGSGSWGFGVGLVCWFCDGVRIGRAMGVWRDGWIDGWIGCAVSSWVDSVSGWVLSGWARLSLVLFAGDEVAVEGGGMFT
jgi:hypothetical protein